MQSYDETNRLVNPKHEATGDTPERLGAAEVHR